MKTISAGLQDELPAYNRGGSRPSRGGHHHQEGCPLAKPLPADEPKQDVFGCMAGTAEISGDIEAPVTPAGPRRRPGAPAGSDPADRLIGAKARAEGLTLVNRDSDTRASTLLKTVW